MKVPSILAPLVVILLVLSFTMAAGMLLVESSAQSVDASLRLLELHTRVVAHHHELSQRALQETQATMRDPGDDILPETWHTVRPSGHIQSSIRVSITTSSR